MTHLHLTKRTFVFLSIIFLLSSCRTAGLYTSNPKGNMGFAGNEFELTKTDSFFVRRWSDSHSNYVDGDGNRIFKDYKYRGYGTYECRGDSMELTFCNEDSMTVVLDLERGNEKVKIALQVFNELGNMNYPHADILSSTGDKLGGTPIIHRLDTFHCEILNIQKPSQIKLHGFQLNIANPLIDISNLESGRHVIKRKSYNGYYPKGLVKNIWFKKIFTGIRFQMHDRKRYLPKKFGWKWINKFYRDY